VSDPKIVFDTNPSQSMDGTISPSDRLGEILLRRGVIQRNELVRAKQEANKRSLPLRDILTGLGIVLEDQINWTLSNELDIPFVLLTNDMVMQDILVAFPLNLLNETRTIPIPDAMGGVTLVMADPLDEQSYRKLTDHVGQELNRAVGPTGRITAILDELLRLRRGSRSQASETITKDTSGVAAVYGMLVAARKKGANRILMRPMGDGIETAFRLERGWIPYRLWSRDQALAIVTRTRIMLGLEPEGMSDHEKASLNTRIHTERVLIEGDFLKEPAGPTIDLNIYPVVGSSVLDSLSTLTEAHRGGICGLFTSRRPTGIIIVNAPDQRQRYRMIYCIISKLHERKLDVISLEERKYLEIPNLRRFELRADTPVWESVAFQQCDALAVCDAPFWRWRDLAASAGERLVILGVDLVSSWLAFRSLLVTVSTPAILADRLRAIWSGKRVDLTCITCGGEGVVSTEKGGKETCKDCDGYGRFRGIDLFEVALVDDQFRDMLAGDSSWERSREELARITVQPTIETQLTEGIRSGVIFDQEGAQ